MEWKFSSDKIVQNDQNKWDRKVSAMTRHFPNVKVENIVGEGSVVIWLSVEELIQLAYVQRSIWRYDLPLWSVLFFSISYR